MRFSHLRVLAIALALLFGFTGRSFALVPIVGNGVSIGSAIVGTLPWSEDGIGWWDPVATSAILRGRVTLQYDPAAYQIVQFGWFGDFGADPSITAPAVITGAPDDAWLSTFVLQQPNGGMTSTVSIDNAAGLMVVNFDWGPDGYTPPSADHFNFFGYTFTTPAGASTESMQAAITGPYGPGKMVVLGGPQDVALNGDNALTYIRCTGGYCGVNPVPEPATWALLLLGFGGVGCALRRRRGRLLEV